MTENRKAIPDGFKYYITFKDNKGQKYYKYDYALSYEYPDGKVEDTTTYTKISKEFKDKVLKAREANTDVSMLTGPQAEPEEVDSHQIDLTTIVIENYNPNRIFDYYE
ncbi:hypothetical protein COL10_03500 [Bacillus cereus]|uniref:hypothetical protein n=1 Tax=Bacillus cereus TaxID=1396 RepID=UPI000BEB2D90|nr:hypothetical protein [Bacillus cereus]PEF92570.1 hypothetical protein CON46_11400 [Bacillus cereus]PFD76443.1 hypothetical protein CN301_05330 [Bacillus cereus]PFV13693.1 hypothetical protein COL10_03500 [Bacillus cereus]PGV45697.1 hypothetical protein COD74_10975 [Bacillus cereus]